MQELSHILVCVVSPYCNCLMMIGTGTCIYFVPKDCSHSCSQLSMHHHGVKAKAGWLRIRIMCLCGATCLPVDCCFSQLTHKHPTKCVALVHKADIIIALNVTYWSHDMAKKFRIGLKTIINLSYRILTLIKNELIFFLDIVEKLLSRC